MDVVILNHLERKATLVLVWRFNKCFFLLNFEAKWQKKRFLEKFQERFYCEYRPIFTPKCQKKCNRWGYDIVKEFLAKWLVLREQRAFKNQFYVVLWIHVIDATCKKNIIQHWNMPAQFFRLTRR